MRYCVITVVIAALAAAVALAFPTVQSTVWSGSQHRELQLASSKSALLVTHARSTTGTPSVEILKVYPHDPKAFTQGLLVAQQGREKFFIESTGMYGESTLRKVDITTGNVVTKYDFDTTVFGEGVTLGKDGELVMITWREKQGFTLDLTKSTNGESQFKLKDEFAFQTTNGEGWGIDYDGSHLVVSDGSANLMFWDPVTKTQVREVTVTFKDQPVPRLNELEFASGFIYANVWFQTVIVKIDPADGKIVAVFDCTDLVSKSGAADNHNAVLNGIAYDGDEDVFYLTGKLWEKMFKVRLLE